MQVVVKWREAMSFSGEIKKELEKKAFTKNSARAVLRDAFLETGSMSNPKKGYHLEFVCEDEKRAETLINTMRVFEITAKTVQRRRYTVVYIKESEDIVKLLNVMGAHNCLMNLENLRILKDMRNSINRRVNCETANISKTVGAANKQIDDIQYIEEHYGFDDLSENLREVAKMRLEYPDATLKELGERLVPPVGKSGVNHRLRKLSELADSIRGKEK
ncbi:MAG: DNA-binding protein WhiA [Lachnospiraceae bacterium]|nr:DNA-binding protein WhiA [Lachnospiraceae bacterium]